ncbi:MAG: efflux RND transporter periplasmic adaptor subunit [Candidatus Aminicenantes bacterium]|jgi:membrane fusion protein (multidrug efflux system)
MKERFKNMALFFIPFAAVLLMSGCVGNSNSQVKSEEEEEESRIPVEISQVTQGSITATYAGSATLEAEGEALVVAKVSGVVEKIFVEEGASVRSGQILAKLDDEQYRLEFNQAKTVLEKLSSEFARNESLYTNKIISLEAYEKTKSDYHTQKAVCDLAQLKLDYTQVKAPIKGIVSLRHIKVGNMVKVDQPTFRITDFDPLLAVLHVPEREMSKLRVGFPAKIAPDALENMEFQGKILRISPVVDAGTGTFKVTVEVKDRTRKLKPGMFARVRIVHDTHDAALLVPKDAVLSEDGERWVFLVKDGEVSKSEIQTGFVNTTHVEVLAGLRAGDTVVTTGLGSLKDGAKIKVVSL